MHPNPAFRKPNDQANLDFARKRGFGTLSINGNPAPLIAHIPFVLADAASHADLHLLRSNPITRALDTPQPAVIAVSGPDSYISPDWYGVDDQVPTWNYVAVHLRGRLTKLNADELPDSIDRLAAHFEARLLPKPPWSNDKMSPEVLEKMMRMIVPLRFDLETIDGTWKLGQTKPDAVRKSAADHVARDGIGQESTLLAALMQCANST